MDNESVWKAVLGELEVQLSKASFTTWFKNTHLVSVEGGKVIISVPNVFTQTWFESKYHNHIKDTLRNILGNLDTVEYIVGNHQEIKESIVAESIKISEEKDPLEGQKEGYLNPKYNFESFVVGSSNKLAHAAAKSVSKKPGLEYNPLFIYGGVGLGKTHLMQAIGNEVLLKSPNKKVMYITAERFTNEFIQSLSSGKTNAFINKYRKLDVLLVDDLAFLAGKERTQEEFFHTFNALHQDQKQIVLTSDRPPKAIPTLEERLRSRFEWGMMADIQPPDLETRIAILQNKSKLKGFNIPLDLIDYIARNIQQNIRELEGALTRIIAHCELTGAEPTINIVTQILGSTTNSFRRRSLSVKTVIDKISDFYDLSTNELLGKKRSKEIVVPRQVAMYLLREELKLSYPKIGQEFGGKDHTTVMHAVGKIEKQIDLDEPLRHEIALIRERLYVN